MQQIIAIFKKELLEVFTNYLGLFLVMIFLLLTYYLVLEPGKGDFFYFREATLITPLYYMSYLLTIFIPAIAMRSWSEEIKSGTIDLLLSYPINIMKLIAGKFLAIFLVILLLYIGLVPYYYFVMSQGRVDLKLDFLALVSQLLMASIFILVSMAFSVQSKWQVRAFFCSSLFCYFLLEAGGPSLVGYLNKNIGTGIGDALRLISLGHYQNLLSRGLLTGPALVYFPFSFIFWIYIIYLGVLDIKKGYL